MSSSYSIWRDPERILKKTYDFEFERQEAWWKWIENHHNSIIASNNDIAIDLHIAIFGDEKGSSCIDIEQLRKMQNRLLSKNWLSQNEISNETLYKLLRLFGNMEEAIARDGYVVYDSDIEDRDILDDFIQ